MKVTKASHISTLTAAGIFALAACGAQADDSVKVNGQLIPQSRFDLLLKQATQHAQQKDSPELRNAIRDRLIDFEIMTQEAVNKGLDRNPDVAARIDMQREQALVDAFAQDYVKNHPVSEDTLKQEYDRIKSGLADKKEYKVRHILVKTEADAKKIIEQLKAGRGFEKLAKEKSIDAGTKAQGGDLGDWLPETVPPNQVPAPFIDAVKKLKKGEYTQTPVQTPFGWHIIRVDDVRPITVPPYDGIKGQLQQSLQNANLKKAIDDLRAKAKIEQ
ncbi:MAG TPA: peptidyl-prolyl cis-trans isomerase [Burkholderiales bacterium]|nr:peptidyl-prolyl cis-trans isomerase [Burkholderiales bacterium]